jgi:hypothetical protein
MNPRQPYVVATLGQNRSADQFGELPMAIKHAQRNAPAEVYSAKQVSSMTETQVFLHAGNVTPLFTA